MNVLLTLLLAPPALAATLTVGPSGDHATVQEAVDAASDGDELRIEAGTFEERVDIGKDLTLIGAGAGTVLTSTDVVVVIAEATVVLQDLTVTAAGERGVSASDADLTLTRVAVGGASGDRSGGGIYLYEGALTIADSSFADADVGTGDGGHVAAFLADVTVTDTSFSSGVAQKGGAVYLYDCEATFTRASFSQNTAHPVDAQARGGAIRAELGTLTLDTTIFDENAADFGGAVSVNAGALFDEDSAYTENTTNGLYGGALAIWDSDAAISRSWFEANAALDSSGGGQAYGGAVLVAGDTGGQVTISGSTFLENQATDYGGAIHASSGTLELDDLTLEGNAAGSGGAIYASTAGRILIQRSEFVGNVSGNGSGIRWRPSEAGAHLHVEDSAFDGNVSTQRGGGIYAYGGEHLEINSTRFTSNEAALGGGMMTFGVDIVAVHNNIFCDNSATGDSQSYGGGALAYESGDTSSLWANNVFAENHAEVRGGGLLLWNSADAEVVNNDFLSNSADTGGQAMFFRDTAGRFVNNLVMEHPQGTAVESSSSPTVALDYNDLYNNLDNLDSNLAGQAGSNNLAVDPGFEVRWSGGCDRDTWFLATESPLVDAGDPSISDWDGSRSDIGAYGGPYVDVRLFTDEDEDGWLATEDCDDTDPDVHPEAPEQPYDGIDQDCDGVDLVDVDEDGWDAVEAGGEDCDDDAAAVNPGATEVWYNGLDEDCDGNDDDQDVDGHGATEAGGDDCDDLDPLIHPGATDTPDDGVDSDCDGSDGPGTGTDDTGIGADDTGVGPGSGDGGKPACGGCAHPGASPWFALGLVLALSRRRRR
ncbi:MAG: hypothetical protein H6739_22055 [Alphaproteobacteria bacterium]|nr:hypothetical protein [Alphaproteobacteria bacterium]